MRPCRDPIGWCKGRSSSSWSRSSRPTSNRDHLDTDPRRQLMKRSTAWLRQSFRSLRKLKDVFRRYRSQPVDRVIYLLNPMLRGRKLRRVLQLHSRLGGKEGPAPYDESSETQGLRLDAVE